MDKIGRNNSDNYFLGGYIFLADRRYQRTIGLYSIQMQEGQIGPLFDKDRASKGHHRGAVFRIPSQRKRSLFMGGHSDNSEYNFGSRTVYSINFVLHIYRGGSVCFFIYHGRIWGVFRDNDNYTGTDRFHKVQKEISSVLQNAGKDFPFDCVFLCARRMAPRIFARYFKKNILF